ncbi:unnamed protein product [Closterium sp. Naga37s-1]|nr:unnamed protein product [Closterium sp. Naga37s-1]
MLPSFMVKLFWKRMDEAAEGVGVGGGAKHKGGGEGVPRVVVKYSYEEEEEIEEDTSRQAQHRVSGPGGNANEQEGSSLESSSDSSSSDELIEHDGEGAGEHPGGTERTEEHGVALGERVDERVKHIKQQATGDDGDVEEQEGGAAAQEGGAGVHQQEGRAAQQEGVVAAQEGGAGGQEQEGREAAQERQVAVRSHRTASGSRQAGPSTSAIASGGQVVELLQRVAEVEASQKKLVADVFVKHSEQAAVFNKLAEDFRTAWNMIPESSKSTLKQCGDVVNGVTEERKLLEGARTKLDEMSGKIIEGVAAAITKASEDAVEKQLKLVEERLVSSVVKGIEKAVKEDLFYSTLPLESMKELKDVVREGYQEAEASRLEVLTKAVARGFRGSAGPLTRSRQEEGVAGVRSGVEHRVHERSVPPSSVGGHVGSLVASPPSRARQNAGKSVKDNEVIVLDRSPLQKTSEAAPKPPPDAFALLRDMLQGLGKKGGKGVVAGEKSGAPIESVASAGKGVVEKRGDPTPFGGAAGKGAGEKREATESSDVEKASTVVAARHEKSKKPKVIDYAPPPPLDDQGKTRGCKAPFKGPRMMSRKGKPVSEQTVRLRKRFLGTSETEADQKFCTAICWRVYFPGIDLKEYEGFTAQDEKDWKVYLDAAAGMPTGVWSVAQEQGECLFDE